MILECKFITKEARKKTLDAALHWCEDVDPKYQNVEFDSPLKDVSELLFVDNHPDIHNYENLPNKIPIEYNVTADKVEYGTIFCPMNSLDLDDYSATLVLEQGMDSNVQEEFSPVNDPVIKLYLDYHWQKSYINVIAASSSKIIYGLCLGISIFSHQKWFLSFTLA